MEITERDVCAPVCIISDMFLGWTVKVANELGIFHSVFMYLELAIAWHSIFAISLNRSLWKVDEEEFLLPDFPEACMVHPLRLPLDLKYIDGADSCFHYRVRQLSFCLRSDAILLNAIEGMGQSGVRYFQRKTGGKPVWSIGPASSLVIKDERPPSSTNNYSEWLDLHQPASVLYVSFGSQASISASQMNELAMGLEASGKAFIWVARPPSGFDVAEEFRAEWLPDGFEERMKKQNRGLLIHRWAPQQEILLHKSTGAFLSHCGWNSALESMCAGVPILGWPLAGEQFFNSHMLEKEVGVCYEIGNGNKVGVIKHNRIAKGINMVLGKTVKGEEMSRKAFEISEKLKDAITEGEGSRGSSVKAMDEFISTALSIDEKTNKV